MRFRTRRRSRSILVAVVAALAALVLPTSTALAEDPPGNNGTIKIDGMPWSQVPNNEPHPGCIFELEFFGFDQGDLTARIRFVVIPPTGDNEVILRDREFIGEDPAGGGTDLDAEEIYDLSSLLSPYMAHDEQGYHIKVIVNAPGSIGNDTKSKVFWVEGCEVVDS